MTPGLFKYFSTDTFKLETFVEKRVLVTPPKYFNDPWDFLLRREPQTEEEVMKRSQQYEAEPRLDDGRGPERLKRHLERVTSAEFQSEEVPYMQQKVSERFGVVSLASSPLDRVMWAHYSDAHRGFVAEFRCNFEEQWRGRPARSTPFGPARKVLYQNTAPQMDKEFTNVFEVCSTKHTAWEYEKEWRVILPLNAQLHTVPQVALKHKEEKTYYVVSFEPLNLVRVILGLRVCPKVRDQLLDMLDCEGFTDVELQIVQLDTGSNRLITKPLSKHGR